MAHIPPDRVPVDPKDRPIIIEGRCDSIKIELPPFYEVDTCMSINLGSEMQVFSVETKGALGKEHKHEEKTPPEKSFKSKIIRIELEDVEPCESGGLAFKPISDGECTVKIIFDHPE